MKTVIILLALSSLTGCIGLVDKTYLTNQQIIAETKKCEDAGMFANQAYNGFTYEVHRVVCQPKNK